MKIAFIGHGNMAKAMISGIEASCIVAKSDIFVSNSNKDNQSAVDSADIIFLTVKPNIYKEVILSLKNKEQKVFVSVAPAITIQSMQSWGCKKVIRTMPNTPALVRCGVTAVCKGVVSDFEYQTVKKLLESFSDVYSVEEEKMDSIIAISGSSPAFAYMLIDAVARHGEKSGIDYEMSVKMIAKTLQGAAQMVLASDVPPNELCNRVCSKNGTTIKAVQTLNENDFSSTISTAMTACTTRAQEMHKELN